MTGQPYGAHPQDTGEFMLGSALATVVLFESDGSVDPSTENWNQLVRDGNGNVVFDQFGRTISVSGPNRIEEVKDRVREGLQWWEDTLVEFYARMYQGVAPIHSLDFQVDFTYAHNPIQTGYEPISRSSNDYVFWGEDFLKKVGFDTFESIHTDIRSFNNSQRVKYGTDWAFTIFVVDDLNDPDDRFAPGGFSRAFAFAGGRFLVSLASRPASTYAHETGHMFWARDEYQYSGASYTDLRGYYNAQNVNAWDNPDPNYVRQNSIMEAGGFLDAAWAARMSSDSSLAMIGWRDSDRDGVFDVLDVPLTLSGTGYYDTTQNKYRFVGHSSVDTLPNRNSSGLQNDITVNRVSQAVYSTNGGGTWMVAANYDSYEADLNFSISLLVGQEVLIRTQAVDAGTGRVVATSRETFRGSTSLPTSVDNPGIHGFAWQDSDDDGTWDVGEKGVPGWTVQLVDATGAPRDLAQVLEPDDFAPTTRLNDVLNGVTVRAVGIDVKDDRVGAVSVAGGSTGTKVFGHVRQGGTDVWATDWNALTRTLRVDFDQPTTFISIDAVALGANGYGRLEVFDASGKLLDRYTTGLLQGNGWETMSIGRSTPDIAYAIARATNETLIQLDNLQVGPTSATRTDALGAYALAYLPPGSYHVKATPTLGAVLKDPVSGIRDVTVNADGKMAWEPGTDRPSDFVALSDSITLPWKNPRNALDVNDDGLVLPMDALIVINQLNSTGSRRLLPPSGGNAPPPYLDVSGDNWLTAMDALLVINYLNGP
ncbi:MAG: hypothetical protein FJ276_27800, partial [Planctomycetes bacterium]|nr:hypothetical protein [Planctomycetota bacterium]